ncbi:hypothetical protein [Actinoplanes regularis]|uniref:hypothetical protein n=1 Tax=Actinoplanes regularis TaxID=52697 RepID=UPI0011785DF8|nr:hypothetical protein [Actinoplanes regularis]GIE84735.1 hypothetical protein Are01nite_12150 [Actinoplanes regularis]
MVIGFVFGVVVLGFAAGLVVVGFGAGGTDFSVGVPVVVGSALGAVLGAAVTASPAPTRLAGLAVGALPGLVETGSESM